MPLSPSHLIEELFNRGWMKSGSRLLSPHVTLWLPEDVLTWLSLESLEREALGRLRRRKRGRKAFRNTFDADRAVDDAQSLLEAVQATLDVVCAPLAQAS